jgi:hypothetical protein
MLPLFYQTHLQQHLTPAQFLFSIRHLAQSPAIVQASEVAAISLCVWLPHYHAPVAVGNYRGS